MKTIGTLAVALSLVLLSACSPSTEPAPAATAPADAATAPTASAGTPATAEPASGTVIAEGGMLTVEPGIVDACSHPENVAVVSVRWDATAAGTEGVQLFLQDAAGNKKLWSAAGAKGSQDTGPWMADGSEVILVNAADSRELGRVKISFTPCAT